jgi:glycosyltransferase involved in cell wall biosynthesis
MLAIVIPFYKATYFKQTLQSLADQTNKNFRIYIGDDNSSEDCKGIIEEYSHSIPINYIRFKDNLGGISLTSQWSRCIDLTADEKWIMLLGDDDILSNNVIALFYQYYETFNSITNVVRFASETIDEKGIKTSKVFAHPIKELGIHSVIRKLRSETRSSISEYIFRKEAYLHFGFSSYYNGFYSDDRAWLDFSDNKIIYSINDAIIQVRISNQSLSGNVTQFELLSPRKSFLKFLFLTFYSRLNKQDQLLLLGRLEDALSSTKTIFDPIWIKVTVRYILLGNPLQLKKFIKRRINKWRLRLIYK